MDTVYRGTYAQFKSIREDSQQLWKIRVYLETGNMTNGEGFSA